jgi:outer membrane biosynthesis protein TonB
MTSKVYRSAQGKMVDLGTLMLQNEHVRAVGNMKVNARGDQLDSNNTVIETKPQKIQRQNNRTSTNVSNTPVQTSTRRARAPQPTPEPQPVAQPQPTPELQPVAQPQPQPTPVAQPQPTPVAQPQPTPVAKSRPVVPPVDLKNPTRPSKSPASGNTAPTSGGLAGAIARSREIKQELDRTRRQQAQDSGLKKI